MNSIQRLQKKIHAIRAADNGEIDLISILITMSGLTVGVIVILNWINTSLLSGEVKEGDESGETGTVDEPEPEPAEPIILPEFENGGTILIVLGILAVLIVGGVIVWRLTISTKHKAGLLREQKIAAQADKQAALAEWNEYVKLHKELQDKVYNAETDWDILFFYPAINDSSIPETRDMLFAMGAVKNISSQPPASLSLDTDMESLRYPKMVQAFEQAWDAAWKNAQKMKQSTLTMKERRTIDKIMHMLKRTKDGATTESEKQIAFERIDSLLSDLTTITVPQRARELLSQQQQLALPAHTVADAMLQKRSSQTDSLHMEKL